MFAKRAPQVFLPCAGAEARAAEGATASMSGRHPLSGASRDSSPIEGERGAKIPRMEL